MCLKTLSMARDKKKTIIEENRPNNLKEFATRTKL